MRAHHFGNLDLGASSQTPQIAMVLNEKLIKLLLQVKEQAKDIHHLKRESNVFFAVIRMKSAKTSN